MALAPPKHQTNIHRLPGGKHEDNLQKTWLGTEARTWIWRMTLGEWLSLLSLWTPISERQKSWSVLNDHGFVRSTKHFGNWKTLWKGELLLLQSLSSSSNLFYPQLYTCPGIISIWPEAHIRIHPSSHPLSLVCFSDPGLKRYLAKRIPVFSQMSPILCSTPNIYTILFSTMKWNLNMLILFEYLKHYCINILKYFFNLNNWPVLGTLQHWP